MSKKSNNNWVERPVAVSRSKALLQGGLTHLILCFASFIVIYPVLWVVKMALTPNREAGLDPNPFIDPSKASLENFEYILFRTDVSGNYLFAHQLFNSVIIALLTTVIGVVLACSAAYGFSRLRFVGREVGLQGFLITQMFPGVVMAIPLYILLGKLGLLNAISGLVLVYSVSALPFCVWNLKGYFDTIPKELEEAAIVDGASRFKIFISIVLPLARPAIAITALFSFMTAWNEFILAATLMNKELAYTLPVALKQFVGAQSADYGYFAAGAILVSIPIMALFFALQKHLVGGLTAGGVKG